MPEQLQEIDQARLRKQRDVIKAQMLVASKHGDWLTLAEIASCTGYPEASISAQLRHLRKAANGGYLVEKRRRGEAEEGLWEYRVSAKKKEAAA